MASKRDLIQILLKGIETGDANAAAVVNEDKYIQHNPQTHEGSEGLAVLFARLAKTNPKVTFVRVFEDGDYAFAHNEYDFASVRVAFEVFRFEDGQAVEHWDNIQAKLGPNPSGRGVLDGSTAITDHDKTEKNRELIHDYVEDVLIKRQFEALDKFVDKDLIQHHPDIGDGIDALQELIGDKSRFQIDKLHKVLAEGNFVLSMCEGKKQDTHTSFYNLFRIENGKIVEEWNNTETIVPKSQWKNDNGKF